jgi:hypothetical protein
MINQWSDKRYTVHNDGTATDVRTGLMWKVCSEGQTWSESSGTTTCSDSAGTYTWKAALEIVNNHTFAEHNDWRVPNRSELNSLVALNRYVPSINLNIFPATPSRSYWSSSPFASNSKNTWIIYFNFSGDGASDRSTDRAVRLVRTSQ